MADSPQVSLLIPAYNPRFFKRSLCSAIAQSYTELEIIVCDDSPGSDIAETVADQKTDRVRYIRNPTRLGFHGNFTKLFSLANGQYVKFLNDDDVLHPNSVARMVAAFDLLGSRIVLVTSRRHLIDENDKVIADTAATTPVSEKDCVLDGRQFGDQMLGRGLNLIGEPSATMFRRADTAPIGDTIFRVVERGYTCLADFALWLRLLAQGKLCYLAEPLSFIRLHAGQLQNSAEVAALCMAERYYLTRDARHIGFLPDDEAYRAVLRRRIDLVRSGLAGTALGTRARELLEEAEREIEHDESDQTP